MCSNVFFAVSLLGQQIRSAQVARRRADPRRRLLLVTKIEPISPPTVINDERRRSYYLWWRGRLISLHEKGPVQLDQAGAAMTIFPEWESKMRHHLNSPIGPAVRELRIASVTNAHSGHKRIFQD
jgi:hypothetical protein